MIDAFLRNVARSLGDQIIDTYWTIATSGLVLALLALGFVGLRLSAMLPLLPAQYRGFARPAALVCAAFFFFNSGYRVADRRADLKQARIDLAFAQTQLENMAATAADKSRLAASADRRVSEISQKVTEYEQRLAAHPLAAGCADPVTDADERELRELANPPRAGRRPLSLIDRLRGSGVDR
jgi:hypothetical protein